MRSLLLAALLVGCSSSSESATPPTVEDAAIDTFVATDGAVPIDSTAPDVAAIDTALADTTKPFLDAPPTEDAPGACNALVDDAKTVTLEYVATAMPAAKGGTIEAGFYERVRVIEYTGVGGKTGMGAEMDRTTAWFAAGKFDIAQSLDGKPVERFSGTYVTTGTELDLTRTCPTPTIRSPYTAYEATSTELTLYSSLLKRALVYRRR